MKVQENNFEKEVRVSYTWKRNTEDIPAIDVDKEWQRFCANHTQINRRRIGWHRWVVAASMLMLCTIGLALGWKYLIKTPAVVPSEAEAMNSVITNDTILEDSTKLTFRNTALNTILQEIAVRHETKVRNKCHEDIYLYVELEKSWTLQECIDFLNHFDRVNLKLTHDNVIVAE